jgi:hypothetical protein
MRQQSGRWRKRWFESRVTASTEARSRSCARRQWTGRYVPRSVGFAGRAWTITCVDVYHVGPDPYEIEIESIRQHPSWRSRGGLDGRTPSTRNAPWGERLSTAAKARGARGAVIDGLVRDVMKIEQLKFHVFAIGINPLDGKGRGIVNAYNMPGICSGVMVNPGDLVFADYKWRNRNSTRGPSQCAGERAGLW